ncbi:MAG: hypothetical protein QF464_22745, partial [Myxococcota bacterium]|nr:hypothetical protein [Myxococcota bacterium]
MDRELDLSARCAPWAAWAEEAAVGQSAHEAGRDRPWPVLHFDDVSAIPFLQDIAGVELYQLRARLRAIDGDAYAATCDSVAGYAPYNRDYLGLESPTFIHAEAVGTACEIGLACQHGQAFEQLADMTRAAGGLSVHPYMGSLPAWDFTRALGEATGLPVRCVGPPPPMTSYANHKGHITRASLALLDDGVLGGAPVVDTVAACTPEALARALVDLAQRHPKVALKMTRCASAMGNGLYTSEAVLRLTPETLRELVDDFLVAKEWVRGEEVLALAWEDAWSSPSTQLWIPSPSTGAPVVEGVYEQLLQGEEQVFLGSVPSRLGEGWDGRLRRASVRLASLFQRLGYRGRCSFDFILVDDRAHVVECNGR